jgi:hypothetical protein
MKALWLALALLTLGATAADGQWQVVRHVDPLTDADRSFTYQTGALIQGRAAPQGALSVNCLEDGPEVSVALGGVMGGSNGRVITVLRFDQAPPLPAEAWILQARNDAATAIRGSRQLIERMKAARTVVIKVTDPLDGEERIWRYSLIGFSAAFNRLSCR